MKKEISLIIFIFCSLSAISQLKSKTYLSRAHDRNSTTYCYSVQELTIYSDSTYISKSWCTSKKEWRKYQEFKPEIDSGKVIIKGNNYLLSEYRNGKRTDFSRVAQITDRRIYYIYLDLNDELKRATKFKRIKK